MLLQDIILIKYYFPARGGCLMFPAAQGDAGNAVLTGKTRFPEPRTALSAAPPG